MIPKHVRSMLPKAGLLSIRWSPWSRWWACARFRLANAAQYQLGPFAVVHRAPWLERSARQLHPHLFEGAAE